MADKKKSKTESRYYLDRDIKLLWGQAAARCAFPNCRTECIAEETEHDRAATYGRIAHIIAHSDSGPRADLSFDKSQRNLYENLILLCANHHDIVDFQPNTYTISDLQGWKFDHENWVRVRLAQEIPGVGFAELEMVSQGLLNQPMKPVENLQLTPPQKKMKKNGLTSKSHFLISLGLSKAKEVEAYVTHVGLIDSAFSERLKSGFLVQYDKLRQEGSGGDQLFSLLHQFAGGYNSSDFKRQAAGLAVLMYLFEKCEVFEA